MGIVLPAVYSQLDERWSKILLGFNSDPKFNFYNFACLLCCQAAVCKYYGKDETPVTLNDKFKALKPAGFAAGTGNYVYGAVTRQYGDIVEERHPTPALLTDAQVGEIKTAIDAGYPVVLQLDSNPKTVANDMHFVLVIAYNPNDENDMTIMDPIGGRTRSLKDYLGWLKPTMRKTIEQYIIYKGNVPTDVPAQCLLVNTKHNKEAYDALIHNSSEWEQIVHEVLGSNIDPKSSQFEQVRSVISGYKSRATDFENKANEANANYQKSIVEIKNKDDQLANERVECQRQITVLLAQVNALKETIPSSEKLEGLYKGEIVSLQNALREAQKQNGIKDLKIQELETRPTNGVSDSTIQSLIDFLKGIFNK